MSTRLRLPFDPIWKYTPLTTIHELAKATGIERSDLYKWAKKGLTWVSADKVACALGEVPQVIWGYDWEKTGGVNQRTMKP